MAYQITDLGNNVLQTVETEDALKAVFAQVEAGELDYNLFWDDEGLVEKLKEQEAIDGASYAIIKLVE